VAGGRRERREGEGVVREPLFVVVVVVVVV